MQLKRPTAIRQALTAATCTLLGAAPAAGAAERAWSLDSALLLYTEPDRVSAVEPVVRVRKDYGDERYLDVKLVADALTGASPNGAAPAGQPQTFTSPSGDKTYTTPPGELPLNDTFRDTRGALSLQWERPLDRLTKLAAGGNVSLETDFFSIGANGALARDYNQRNTTLSAGAALEYDLINPQGGTPGAFTSMGAGGGGGAEDEGKDRQVVDLLFGLTQVISRRALMQLNYNLSYSNGYHADPYKILSVVDGATGTPLDYLFESRPDSRFKQSLYWQGKYHLERDIVDLSYRYLSDDWGITSHTVDAHYRWQIHPRRYLEPHVRYYTQSAADFFRHSLIAGAPLPAHASADLRLAEFDAATFGVKYAVELAGDQEFSVRLEIYQQRGDGHPAGAIGAQQSQNLFPDFDAYIVQFGYALR